MLKTRPTQVCFIGVSKETSQETVIGPYDPTNEKEGFPESEFTDLMKCEWLPEGETFIMSLEGKILKVKWYEDGTSQILDKDTSEVIETLPEGIEFFEWWVNSGEGESPPRKTRRVLWNRPGN